MSDESLVSLNANVQLFPVPERGSNLIEFAVRVGNGERDNCKVKGFAKWDKARRTVKIVAYKKPFDVVTSTEVPVTTESPASGIEQLVKRDIELTINQISQLRSSLERVYTKAQWLKRIKRNGVANIRVERGAEVDVADDEGGDMVAYEFGTYFDILRGNRELVPSIGRFIVFFEDETEERMVGSMFEILAVDEQPMFIQLEPQTDCDSVTQIFDRRDRCLRPTLTELKEEMRQRTEELMYFKDFQKFLSRCGLW